MGIERPRNGSGLMSHNQVATSTTAAIAVPQFTGQSRSDVTLLNMDTSATIFVGGSMLTAANGFPLAPGASLTLKCWAAIYAVASAGTPKLAYITDEE